MPKRTARRVPSLPDKPATRFDWPNTFTEPTPDGTYVLQSGVTENRTIAAFLMQNAARWQADAHGVNADLVNYLGEFATKLLGMNMLSLDTTVVESSDGLFHLNYTIDPANPGHYTLNFQYPASALIGGTGTGMPAAFNTPALIEDPLTIGPSVSLVGSGTSVDPYHLTFKNLKGADGTNGTTPIFNAPAYVDDPLTTGPSVSMTGDGSSLYPYHLTFKNLVGPIGPDGLNGAQGPQGATGAQGPQGPQGPIALFNTPAILPAAYGTEPLVSLVGSGTSTDPYHLSFTLPAGAPGADAPAPVFNDPAYLEDGSTPAVTQVGSGTPTDPYHLSFHNLRGPQGVQGAQGIPGASSLVPATLPTIGQSPITFDLEVYATGTTLPWVLPKGYTLTFTPIQGLWGAFVTAAGATVEATLYLPINDTLDNGQTARHTGRLAYNALPGTVSVPVPVYEAVLSNGDLIIGPLPDDNWINLLEQPSLVGTVASLAEISLTGSNSTLFGTPTFGSWFFHVTVTPPVGAINLTYSHGTGPLQVNIGDTFTITPDPNGFVDVSFDKKLVIKWVSGTHVLLNGSIADFAWWYAGSYNSGSATYYVTTSGDLTAVDSHIGEYHPTDRISSFAGAGSGPYVLQITGWYG